MITQEWNNVPHRSSFRLFSASDKSFIQPCVVTSALDMIYCFQEKRNQTRLCTAEFYSTFLCLKKLFLGEQRSKLHISVCCFLNQYGYEGDQITGGESGFSTKLTRRKEKRILGCMMCAFPTNPSLRTLAQTSTASGETRVIARARN